MIAVYIDDNSNNNLNSMISYIVEFTFVTLGYSYKIIYSLKGLTEFDVLVWYDSKGIQKDQIANFAKKIPIIVVRYHENLYIPSQLKGNNLTSKIKKIKFYNEVIPIIHNNLLTNIVEEVKQSDIALTILNFDIFGNLYFHITDCEFRAKKSDDGVIEQGSVFDEYYHEPIVNYLLSFIEKIILNCCQKLDFLLIKKEYWPHGEDYAVIFTHSIDKLEKWGRGVFGEFLLDCLPLILKGKFSDVFRNLSSGIKYFFTDEEQYWNFENYLKLDNKYGIISTWFVSLLEDNGFVYNVDEKKMLKELNEILGNGHELGILVNPYEMDQVKIKTAFSKLLKITKEEQSGIRVAGRPLHESISLATHRNNLQYDCSIVSPNIDLFKNGNILPHHKLIEGIRTFQLEIPITFSDEILKSSKYSYRSYESTKQKMDNLLMKVNKSGGLICFDFTISNFKDISYLEKLYTYTLERIKETNYYNNSCKNIASWWKSRKNVIITNVEWGANILFLDDFPFFTFKVHSKKKIRKVTMVDHQIEDNIITMSNIKANTVVDIEME